MCQTYNRQYSQQLLKEIFAQAHEAGLPLSILMMDIDEFTAIINPPDSCILAVGKIKEVVVKTADGFGVKNVMKVTLSCDHRRVGGAVGASFLQTLKKYGGNAVWMLV